MKRSLPRAANVLSAFAAGEERNHNHSLGAWAASENSVRQDGPQSPWSWRGHANIPAASTLDPLVPIMTHCHMYTGANPAFPTPSFSFKANRYTQGWKTATSTLSVHVSPTDKSFALAVCWRPARLGGKGQGRAGPFSQETQQQTVQGSPPPCLGKKNNLGLNF